MTITRKPKLESIDSFIKGATDTVVVSEKGLTQEQSHSKDVYLNKLRRQSYYLTELHIEAINQMSFFEKLDKSEIVRKALDNFITQKYFELAKNSIK